MEQKCNVDSTSELKAFFAHELRRSRAQKGITQAEAAECLGLDTEAYIRLENSKVVTCLYGKSVEVLHKLAAFASNEPEKWLRSVLRLEDSVEIDSLLGWETSVLKKLREIDPVIRRTFTKNIEKINQETTGIVILISNYLFSLERDQLLAVLALLQVSAKGSENTPKTALKNFLKEMAEKLE